MRDQRRCIDRFAIGLRMELRIAVEFVFQTGRACKSQLDAAAGRQRPQPQFLGWRAHRDVPRLNMSGW